MPQQLHVKTINGYYLQATGGGGREVSARGPWPREHETFTIVPVTGDWDVVRAGSRVRLRAYNGQYVIASGAQGDLAATGTTSSAGSVFTVARVAGEPDQLGHLSRFALAAHDGRFVCAENGGGDVVHANRTALGPWETFEARLHPEPADSVLTTGIRTVSGIHFLQAANGGGADLSARGPWALEWETFDLVAADRAARGLPDGARVNVRTDSWHYLQAEGGGGGKVSAAGPWPREWETFTLVVPGRRPWLRPGSKFGLRAYNGRFVEAERGGGGAVIATATALTPAATFVAAVEPVRSAAPVRMLTGAAAREDSTVSGSFVELVPTPGQVFTTARPCTLVAQLTTECRMSAPGGALEVRVTVDGQQAHPGPVVLTSDVGYATRTYVAFIPSVSPGEHLTTVQWRVRGGRGYVRNRTFTVYEIH